MGLPVQLVGEPLQKVLVVGGGLIAARRVESILEAGGSVTVVSPDLCQDMLSLLHSLAAHRKRPFAPADLEGAQVVFAATDDRIVNRQVADLALRRGLLVNAVDDPERCNFFASAVVRRGPVTVAVGSSGKAPLLAGRLRRYLELAIPDSVQKVAERLRVAREVGAKGVERLPTVVDALLDRKFSKLVDVGDLEGARARWARFELDESPSFAPGTVAIVGAGSGGRSLLTIGALQLIHRADVVVHDALVTQDVLDEVLPGTELIAAGRRAGGQHVPQREVERMIVERALEGQRVLRLHAGDPAVFGRVGEEIDALIQARVPYQLLPGVSSVLAAPLAAGIPLTLRGVARGFTVRTGHTAEGPAPSVRVDADQDTLVVLMAHGTIRTLMRDLQAEGRSKDTPVAAISRAGWPDQEIVRATVATIAQRAEGLARPVTFVVGEAAAYAEVGSPALEVA